MTTAAFAPARAAADESRWHLGVEPGTDFPLDVGARLWTEGPGRLRMSLAIGYLPGTYVETIGAAVQGFGGTAAEAELLRVALESSSVARAHVGWRPFRDLGLYAETGYGMIALGGGATSGQLIEAFTGEPPPEDAPDRRYRVYSTLHMIDAEVGWQESFAGGLTLRAALGYAGTLAADTAVRPDTMPRDAARTRAYTDLAEAKLDALYTTYVHAPVLSVAAGWRFF